MMNEECVTILRTQDFAFKFRLVSIISHPWVNPSLQYVVAVLYFNPSYLHVPISQVNIWRQ